jgi:hypothetical protein
MTDRPVKIGSISAQILALMLTNEHYKDRYNLLMDLSAALNKEYHALATRRTPRTDRGASDPSGHCRSQSTDQTGKVG